MITTNDVKPTGPRQPQKLNQITTAIIGNERTPEVEFKPADPTKMITTNMGAEGKPGAQPAEDNNPATAPSHKKPGRPKKE